MRKNGFSRPYAPLQIATWVTLPMLVLQFLFFVSPLLPIAASIPCTIVFFAFAMASAHYTYMACVTDPVDTLRHLNGNENSDQPKKKRSPLLKWLSPNPIVQSNDDNSTDDTKHCWVCDTRVHEHAMHCKYCDKCVANFDHHCQWLNTCVGQANYPYFYATLWAISGQLLIHLCIMLALVVDNFVRKDCCTQERADEWFGANASAAVTAVNIFFIIFVGIALSLVVQLLWFHLGLRKEGLTTYQYIVKDNANKREKNKAVAARKQKRILAISKARAEKKNVLANRLILGEYLKCCDPLPPDVVEAAQQETMSYSHGAEGDASAANGNNGEVQFVQVNGSRRAEDESKEPEKDPLDLEAAQTTKGAAEANGTAANGEADSAQVNKPRGEDESKEPEDEFAENGN